MDDRSRKLLVTGYVYGSGNLWQGICLNFDIAAQGESLEQTKKLLFEMVVEYVQYAHTLPEADKKRLLKRQAPFSVRMTYHVKYFMASLFGRNKDDDRLGFVQHIPAFG